MIPDPVRLEAQFFGVPGNYSRVSLAIGRYMHQSDIHALVLLRERLNLSSQVLRKGSRRQAQRMTVVAAVGPSCFSRHEQPSACRWPPVFFAGTTDLPFWLIDAPGTDSVSVFI
jgi:hypothetical protein